MEQLKLIVPCERFLASYKQAYDEDVKFRSGEEEFFCPPDIVIEQAYKYRNDIDLPQGYVPSTMLWMVSGEDFIGCVDIRHRLTDRLLRFGGHIGYEVRYSKWNMGYGTKMLALTLQYVKEHFDFDKVLITCNADNPASARVIEKNGGTLEDIVENIENGKCWLTKRYWIRL